MILGIVLSLWIVFNPSQAQVPSIPSEESLIFVQENSMMAGGLIVPETHTLGVVGNFNGKDDIGDLEREKYQQFFKKELLRIGKTEKDFLIMKEVVFCECGWEHYYLTGKVKVSKGNVGFGQINIVAHQKTYTAMDLDIYEPYDNLRFTAFLYKRDGLKPWLAWSGHCFLPRI